MSGIIILYVVLIIVILLLAPYLKKAKVDYIGKVGEDNTLTILQSISNSFIVIKNLFLPTSNGRYTEIDSVLITDKCIFVIETKNYSGWIFGNEKSKYWMQVLYQNRNHFYNPIMQNATHIKYLQKQIGYKIPIFSIIVFSNRSLFKEVKVYSDRVKVCHLKELSKVILNIYNFTNFLITNEKMNDLSKKLTEFTNPDESIKEKHIEYIKNHYK